MIFRYFLDLRCHLANGEVELLRDVPVTVHADSQRAAKTAMKAVATETVHDRGGELTSAPLNYLDIVRVRLA